MKKISEVRIDYIDDENLQHIDCWFTDDDNEEGKTVGVVDLDTNKVIFFDNAYRNDKLVKEIINQIVKGNKLSNDIFTKDDMLNLLLFSGMNRKRFKGKLVDEILGEFLNK